MRALNIFIFFTVICCSACQKNWLNAKPDSQLVVLSTVSDYQTLMDNSQIYLNGSYASEMGGDNYYINPSYLATAVIQDIDFYTWAMNGYGSTHASDWTGAYEVIYGCNTALDGLNKVAKTTENAALWNQVYGTALFFRAYYYYSLAEEYTKPYDSLAAPTNPGVPLRLEADVTVSAGRGTIKQLYDQIFADLVTATSLLPNSQQAFLTRPNKVSGYALLARICLAVGNYASAGNYADSALQYQSTLLDYNSLPIPTSGTILSMPPFAQNPEVIFETNISAFLLFPGYGAIDTALYASYAPNDLRKQIFFNISVDSPLISFIGSYDGVISVFKFAAPAVDEMYLIRAECYARGGNVAMAMSDLNSLLVKRWKTGSFVPYTANSPDDALIQILKERRKELVMRGTRWADLRRLNTDPRFAVTIKRVVNGQTYILVPNSNAYAWPIPDDEILYSGIPQNPK